jgi:hypothetical protein
MYESGIPGAVPIRLTDLQHARRKASPIVRSLVLSDDPWEKIMEDSDADIQPLTLLILMRELPLNQMRALLDWMAQEYAGCKGWMDYAERETATAPDNPPAP